jgi:hypothetical protein
MEVTLRGLVTMSHGMLFGGFFLTAVFSVVVGLWRSGYETGTGSTPGGYARERAYLVVTAALGWVAVLSGAYVVYPWYRALPPVGVAGLSGYPQRLLLSSAATAGWHTLGMEWKEHVAWMAPIAMTMVAYVLTVHRGVVREQRAVRRAVVGFALVALVAAGVAGFFGAMINKNAPVEGGRMVVLMRSSK